MTEVWPVPSPPLPPPDPHRLRSPLLPSHFALRSSLQRAGDSDASVMARLKDCEPQLSDLTVECAVTKMPRLQAPMVSDRGIVIRRNRDGVARTANCSSVI